MARWNCGSAIEYECSILQNLAVPWEVEMQLSSGNRQMTHAIYFFRIKCIDARVLLLKYLRMGRFAAIAAFGYSPALPLFQQYTDFCRFCQIWQLAELKSNAFGGGTGLKSNAFGGGTGLKSKASGGGTSLRGLPILPQRQNGRNIHIFNCTSPWPKPPRPQSRAAGSLAHPLPHPGPKRPDLS
jgi:hypothetical protein